MKPEKDRQSVHLALMALLGAGPFWSGLYSAGQQLIPTAVLAVLVLRMRGKAVLTRLEIVAMVLLMAGAAASLSHPASVGNAAHGPLIAAGWMLAMLVARRFVTGGQASSLERLLGRTWAVAGCVLVFASMGALSYLPAHHSGRLAGFLGYPIALGMMGLLGLAGCLPLLGAGRWWAAAVACANGAAVVLSGSRGIWAVGALLALYLLWARPALLRRTWAPVLGALAAGLWAGPAVTARHPMPGLLALVLACLTVAAVDWLHDRFPAGRLAVIGAAAIAWIAAAALAPGWPWLLGRAAAGLTEGSSVERLTFLRDGWAMVRVLPLGAGFKAWAALHLQGASYSYYSAEAHSAPLDLALAFGWAGVVGFLLLLGRYLWRLREGRGWAPERVAVLAGVGALALHSLLDWDLSYGIFTMALWLGFGLMGPAPGRRPLTLPPGVTVGLASIGLAGVVLLGAGDVAQSWSEQALAAGNVPMAYQHASLAVSVNPWNDMGHAAQGRALSAAKERDAAIAAFARARVFGPYEPWYVELQAGELVAAGRWREAAAAYRDYVHLWPWETSAYEEALNSLMDLTVRADLAGDHALAQELAATGRAILTDLDRQKAKEPPDRPRQPMQTDTRVLKRARTAFTQGG